MSTTRIGIIGAGYYCATTHVPTLQAMRGVEVVATCRTREDKLRAFNERFGIRDGYTDYRKLLERDDLDGVIVASPHANHYEHAAAVLERGLPLLLEKPMTIDQDAAQELVAYAQQQQAPVVVGYNRQYWHNYDIANGWMDAQRIGAVQAISAVWRSNLLWALKDRAFPAGEREAALWQPGDPPNFRSDAALSGGGSMADAGAHLCHAVTYLSRLRPVQVQAWSNDADTGIDVNWAVSVRFAGGAVGSLSLLGFCHEHKQHEVLMTGEHGLLRVDDDTAELTLREGANERVEKAYQKSVAENFVGVIRGREAPVCSIHDGYRAQVLLSAIYQSAREGRLVDVRE